MRKHLFVAFALLVIAVVALSAISFQSIMRLDKINNDLIWHLEADMTIDEKVADHHVWTNGLLESLISGKEFTGELDPKKCDFAQWFYGFKTDDGNLMQMHARMEEPHKKLHEIGASISALAAKGDKDSAFDMYKQQLEKVRDEFVGYASQMQRTLMGEIEVLQREHERVDISSKMLMGISSIIVLLLTVAIAIIVMISTTKIITKLTGATGQITSASSEILAATQEQASGAREQSAAVSETTSASKELSKSAEQVGDSIRRVSEATNHALLGMAKIKDLIGKTGSIISSLSEKSQKIGKITDVIDDVADQTNLLAVNAAIEAARAGEQGRGFTVVADEIRKLADSTAKSTKDITALIEVIQHEMSNAIISMESSVNSVDEEVKLSQDSSERAKEIAMSTTQQISGSKQIAEAMANIDEAMKQIAASAQQSQVAVKQLTDLGKELKDVTDQLK